MICNNCGAPLTIEDKKCPYCGTQNPEYVKHKQDMSTFFKIHSVVLRKARENAEKARRRIILCTLITLTFFSFVYYSNSWSLGYKIQEWKSAAKSEEYRAQLDLYEENSDFLSFVSFYEQKQLYNVEAFGEYRYVYNVASNYVSIYYDLVSLTEEEPWEDAHKSTLKYMNSYLEYFYELLEQEPYEWYAEMGAYDEDHLTAVEEMEQRLENLIRLCLNVPAEDMEGFRDLTSAEKRVFIERRYLKNE